MKGNKKEETTNKRKITIILLFIALAIIILLTCLFCGKKDFDVTFQIGDRVYTSENILAGGFAEEPEPPEREGYTFKGWYVDGEKFDFESKITKDTVLEAVFEVNTYTVLVNDGNGNETELKVEHGKPIEEPKVEEKKGYNFAGWYVDGEEFHFEDGVGADTKVEGKWTLKEHALYRVEHYLQQKDGSYPNTYEVVEVLDGKTNSTVTPATHTYRGYQSPSKKSVKVEADGSTTVKYYYELKTYVLLVAGDTGISEATGSGKYYYGDKIDVTYTLRDGYHFVGYSKALKNGTFTMPDEDVLLRLKSEANTDTPYRVEHYLQNIDGTYPEEPKEVDELNGTTDTEVTPTTKTYEGFSAPKAETVTVQGDGSTVVRYEYTRNQYTVTIEGDGGIATHTPTGSHYYGEEITIEATLKPGYNFKGWSTGETGLSISYQVGATNSTVKASTTPIEYTITYELNGGKGDTSDTYTVLEEVTLPFVERTGYTFKGWYTSEDFEGEPVETISIGSTGNKTFYAKWEANTNTPYRVEHYLQNIDGTYPKEPKDVDTLEGTTDTKVTPVTKTYTGFTAPNTTTVTVNPDGSTVVRYEYTRNQYQLTLKTSTGISKVTGDGKYYYGEEVTISYELKPGYSFVSWKQEGTEATMPNTFTMPAKNITLTATAKAEEVGYHVKHYIEDLNSDNYSIYKDEKLSGTTDTEVTPNVLDIPGFTAPQTVTKTVSGNGTTVIEYRYTRNTYDVTVNAGTGIEHTTGTGKYEYGDTIEVSATLKPGYHDIAWSSGVTVEGEKATVKVPVDGITVTATATPNTATKYTVRHHYMDVNGEYSKESEKYLHSGTTDATVDAPLQPKEGFKTPVKQQVTIAGDESTSVDYYYEREKYTVTIEKTTTGVESLTKTEIKDIYFEAKVTLNQDIVKYSTGYEFDKLSYDGKSSTDETLTFNMPSHNVTVTVVPKQIEYKVSFDTAGYSGRVPSQTKHYGDRIDVPQNVSWDHHDFKGWYLKKSDGTLADTAWNFEKDTMPASNITLVAKWETHKGTLTFVFGFEGQTKGFKNVTYDTTIQKLLEDKQEKTADYTEPKHTGYVFLGWYTSPEFQEKEKVDKILEYKMPDDKGVTLYANWRPITYTIEFMPNGGEEVEHVKQERIYEDINFMYHTHYHEGNIITVPLTKNTYTREGYTFQGWAEDEKATEAKYTDQQPVGNMTENDKTTVKLYAVWKKNTYTVEYNVNKGAGSSDPTPETIKSTTHTYDEESALTSTTVSREGYEFLGWSKKQYTTSQDSCKDCVTKAKNLTSTNNGTVTLYAVWKANSYTVTYNSNKGDGSSDPSGEVASTTHTYDGHEKLSSNQYARDGYIFQGWATTADATVAKYMPGEEIPNLAGKTAEDNTVTLYAVWAATDYTVTYDANVPETSVSKATGTVGNTTHTYDTSSELSSNKYERAGYNFLGWSTKADATEAEYQPGATVSTLSPSENITLYAVWEKITYHVSFNNNFGTTTSKDYTVEDSVTFRDPIGHDGYKFKGWYEKETGTQVTSIPKGTTRSYELEAKWDTVPYSIKYEGLTHDGSVSKGTVPENAKNSYTVLDETYTLSTPIRNGYEFKGWYTTNNYQDGTEVTSITKGTTGDKTFYAKWTIITYKVTLVDKTLGTSSNVYYDIEKGINLDSLGTQNGYTFDGWYDNENCTGNPVKSIPKGSTGEKTYYAKRTGIPYTVIYSKDGTSTVKSETFIFGSKHTAAAADTIKNPYTVTFNANGGKTIANQTVNATVKTWKIKDSTDGKTYTSGTEIGDLITPTQTGQTVILVPQDWNYPTVTLPSTTKDSDNAHYVEYELEGWYKDSTKWTNTTPVTQNIELTAHWKNMVDTDQYIKDNIQDTTYFTSTLSGTNVTADITAVNEKVTTVLTENGNFVSYMQKLLTTPGVKTVTLKYSSNTYTITKDNIYAELKKLAKAMTDTSKESNESDRKLSSLYSSTSPKKFTIQIDVDSNSGLKGRTGTSVTYTTTFTSKKVESNSHFLSLSNKVTNNTNGFINSHRTTHYELLVDGNKLTLKYVDPSSSIISAMSGSGVKTAFWAILGEESQGHPSTFVESLTLKFVGKKTMNVTTKPENVANNAWTSYVMGLATDLVEALGKFGGLLAALGLKNSDLAGLSVTVTLNVRSDWALEDDFSYPLEYTITFGPKS